MLWNPLFAEYSFHCTPQRCYSLVRRFLSGWRSPETSKKMIAEAVAAGNERNEK